MSIVAMLIVGTTIGAVAVARLTFAGAQWVTEPLVRELTTLCETFVGVIACAVSTAVAIIAIARIVRRWSDGGAARYISMLAIVPAAAILIALGLTAYIAIPLAFLFNEKMPFGARTCEWCKYSSTGWGKSFANTVGRLHEYLLRIQHCSLPERWAWWALVGTAAVILFYALQAIVFGGKDEAGRTVGGRLTGALLSSILLLAVLAVCNDSGMLALLTWLLLAGSALFVRSFLIQYVGDVAIYVAPHMVDRFFDLRIRIKAVVWRAARAVYACVGEDGELLYDKVVIAGHSLGSVVVYDVLNRLINEDDLAGGAAPECCEDAPVELLDVSRRTKLLLTFGSPLDKTAFVFARNDPHGGSERDALASSVQPLIARERDFAWVNVWTPFDILGGSLEFYDTPEGDPDRNEPRVVNKIDPDAITPIAAHNEFWHNSLIYKYMYYALE
ncbi:MAG: hypothetical protein JO197_21755 [Acidobacteria bacterium]|nr:hypothetical protein [Acidobacteriota bacterium]